MSDLSPAGVLRAAAARLRELEGNTMAGRWTTRTDPDHGQEIHRVLVAPTREGGHYGSGIAIVADRGDADYIAMMGPPVALADADLLETAADAAETLATADELMSGFARSSAAEHVLGRLVSNALTAARAVLEGDRHA